MVRGEGHWLDDVARMLARGASRREVLRHVGIGLAGAMLTALSPRSAIAAGHAGKPSRVDCPPGQILCKKECIDPDWDVDHCGGCFQRCKAGEVCRPGVGCQACPAGLTRCLDRNRFPDTSYCADLTSDNLSCGKCGRFCPLGGSCIRGRCMCPPDKPDVCTNLPTDSTRPPTKRDDASPFLPTCLNLQTDHAHCGKCFHTCRSNEQCIDGECLPVCPPGQILCKKECIDPDWDVDHCGGCFQRCKAGEVCRPGVGCQACPAGLTRCLDRNRFPDMSYCADLTSDNLSCGKCGRFCPLGGSCIRGRCMCPPDKPDVCTNLPTDSTRPPTKRDDASPFLPTCLNLQTDHAHCGKCFHACRDFEVCVGGKCVCPDGSEACGTRCCTEGAICRKGKCVCVVGDSPPDVGQESEACGEGCCSPERECCQGQDRCVPKCTAPKVLNQTTCQCDCPQGQTPCGSTICCPSGQICGPDGACLQNCSDPNAMICGGECCPFGRACCGGVCCAAGNGCAEDGSCVACESCPPGQICDVAFGVCMTPIEFNCFATPGCGPDANCCPFPSHTSVRCCFPGERCYNFEFNNIVSAECRPF